MTGAPKVFISYSHDTVEHQEPVLGLADRLRADGIDAEIDQYNAAPSASPCHRFSRNFPAKKTRPKPPKPVVPKPIRAR